MAPRPLNRILYVEDDPDIRAVAELALKDIAGYEVDLCCSGPEAVALARSITPDLVILDIMMPGMDGIETFKRLREIPGLATTPVVFMTAKAMQPEIGRYISLGAAAVIPKPFDPLELPSQIAEIWQRAWEDAALI